MFMTDSIVNAWIAPGLLIGSGLNTDKGKSKEMLATGILLGLAVVIAVYLLVNRADRNYYKRRLEAIEKRRLRIEERRQEQSSEQDDLHS